MMEKIGTKTQKRLDALEKRSRRSNPTAACVASAEWQLDELQAGIQDLDAGRTVSHEKVSNSLNTWGKTPAGQFNT